MTEQKSTQLTPEEWKQLCVLNVNQLLEYLKGIPPQGFVSESDPTIISGLTIERMDQIEAHLERGSQFLRAWNRARPIGAAPTPPQAAQSAPEVKQEPVPEAPAKKRGRPPKVKPEAQASQH